MKKYCHNCGYENASKDKYCAKCGKELMEMKNKGVNQVEPTARNSTEYKRPGVHPQPTKKDNYLRYQVHQINRF